MLRSVVAIMGTVALAVGFAQILRPGTWPVLARALVAGEYVTSCGLVAIWAGIALLVAGVRHLVRIPLFVIVVGGYFIIFGVVMFVYPDYVRDKIWELYLYKSPSVQTVITIAGAVVRAAIGALLLYAGLVAPKAKEPVLAIPVRRDAAQPEDSEQVEK